jgi:hypothetical protein
MNRHFPKKRVLVLVPAIGWLFGAIAHAGLILNGSFESPGSVGNAGVGREQYFAPSLALTNWTVAGSGDVFLHKSPDMGDNTNASFNFAQDGDFYLDLSGSYADGAHATVYQDFATVPLTAYELTFYIGAANLVPPAATIQVQLTGTSSLLDTTLTPLAPLTNINWALQTFSFVADSTTTRLSFTGVSASDDNASFVDTVSVVSVVSAVPEPASGIIFLFGAAVCWLLRLKHNRPTRNGS